MANEKETLLKKKLGIPDDASKVIFFTETSHWDPDWLFTSDEYFNMLVKKQLMRAVDELDKDSSRVYSIECMFFLKMFFDRVESYRQRVVDYVNSGRLRLMGSGVTTPDTIVPQSELIMRDYAIGLRWLQENGMNQIPTVAYFPDTFGFSPGLPEILTASGMDSVGLCRLDGMYFFGNEYESSSHFPKRGTTAFRLKNELKSADFIWQSPTGSEVLCRWLAFTYGQGEKLAHFGISRELDLPFVVSARGNAYITRMILKYVKDFEPMTKTPYTHCPIGFDFSSPIRDLGQLLSNYNEKSYPNTGIWAHLGGLDDYFALIRCHLDRIPKIAADPSQYFTGFFTSRPTVKRLAKRLAVEILNTETALSLSVGDSSQKVNDILKDPWWTAGVTNHHDFVTGTATNRVVKKEQIPMMESAIKKVKEAAKSIVEERADERKNINLKVMPTKDSGIMKFKWLDYEVVLKDDRGGTMDIFDKNGEPLLSDCLTLSIFEDYGGLWRMGNEYKGGIFSQIDSTADGLDQFNFTDSPSGTMFVVSGRLDNNEYSKTITFDAFDPVLRVKTIVTLNDRRTACLSFGINSDSENITMDTPGAVVSRDFHYLYTPTFWAQQRFSSLGSNSKNHMSFITPLSTASTFNKNGDRIQADFIVARNAKKEFAYKVLPLLAQPSFGKDPGSHEFNISVCLHGKDDWRKAGIPNLANSEMNRIFSDKIAYIADEKFREFLEIDGDGLEVLAFKRSYDLTGFILRLNSYNDGDTKTSLTLKDNSVSAYMLVNAREESLGTEIKVTSGKIKMMLKSGISSIKLIQK